MHSKAQNEHDALIVVLGKLQNQMKRIDRHVTTADKLFNTLVKTNEKKTVLIND